MRMMFWGLVFGAALSAQTSSYFPPMSDQLKSYLQLGDSQVAQIAAINSDFGKFLEDRLTRQFQLTMEIAAETAKATVDPMALGVRYAELESIRRDVSDEGGRVRTRTIALLNDTQKALLKVLDQAMRLGAEISDGQCQNLLEPAPPIVITRSSTSATSSSSTSGMLTSTCGAVWISSSTLAGPAAATRPVR